MTHVRYSKMWPICMQQQRLADSKRVGQSYRLHDAAGLPIQSELRKIRPNSCTKVSRQLRVVLRNQLPYSITAWGHYWSLDSDPACRGTSESWQRYNNCTTAVSARIGNC